MPTEEVRTQRRSCKSVQCTQCACTLFKGGTLRTKQRKLTAHCTQSGKLWHWSKMWRCSTYTMRYAHQEGALKKVALVHWCVHTMQYAHKEKQLGQTGLNFLKLHPNGPKPLYCCCSLQALKAKAICCAISLFSSVCLLSEKPFCLLLPWAQALNQIKLALPFSLAF